MIAIELKKSILLAAISGKLTFQNENENAQEIFKTNEIITADFPFDIPQNWVWTKVKFIGNVVGGGTPKTNESRFWGGEIPWITPADMSNIHGRYVSNGKRSITSLGLEKSSARLLPQNSVIFSSRAPIGYCAIAKNPLATNQGFKSVIPFNSQMSDYVYYYFLAYADEIAKLGSGTTFKEISGETVKNIYISIPPLAEQKRIVEKLDTLLPLIDSLEKDEIRLKELMQQFPDKMRDSILQAAMEGRITEQLSEDGSTIQEVTSLSITDMTEDLPFDIPENWQWVTFGDIVEYKMGKTPPREKSEYWGKGYNWISIADMRGKGLVENTTESVTTQAISDIFRNNISPKGTLIMSFKLTVGRVTFLGIDAVHNEAIISIYPKYGGDILKQYLAKILPMVTKLGDTKDAIKGPTLNSKSISKLLIPLPPLAEQRRIVEKLNQILPLVETIST